jgi:hypothetical protein
MKSRRTHDHILLSHLRPCFTVRDSPNLESQVPVFIPLPTNRVAPLYLRALRSLFVASYETQGHGGNILTRLHTGQIKKTRLSAS